jgi:NADH-quinone oxidoreductase subunit A
MKNFNFFVLNEYINIFSLLCVSFFLAILLVFSSFFLIAQNPNSEKLTAYECGYESYENTRHTFNVNFCLISLFFLIFDVEMLFLIPWCLNISEINLLSFWCTIDFIFELCIGYFYIWYLNSLDW